MNIKKNILLAITTAITVGMFSCLSVQACTTVLVGKDATSDHSIIIARNEDNKPAWAKRFIVHPQTFKGYIYHSNYNNFKIQLPGNGQRYTATPDYNAKAGVYGESGVNSSNVAMSCTESTNNNNKVQKADPFVRQGISEDSMLGTVLPYVKSAREGVMRLGHIIETKGTAENDGIIFADNHEAWYFESGSGHHWAAERLPDNKYAVIPNEIVLGKLNLKDKNNFLADPSLMSFVKKNRLSGYKNNTITFFKAFGTNLKVNAIYDGGREWDGQRILSPSKKQHIGKIRYTLWVKPDHKITIKDVQKVLSSHFNGTKYDPYGQWKDHMRPIGVPYTVESHIFQMRPWIKNNRGTLEWLAMASPETSTYVPFFVDDISNTPKEYQYKGDGYNAKSAYWVAASIRQLAQQDHNKLVKKYLLPNQNELYNFYTQKIKEVDDQLKNNNMSNSEADQLFQKANTSMASKAMQTLKKINGQLIIYRDKNDRVYTKLKQEENSNYAD